jgi:cell division protein FtsA
MRQLLGEMQLGVEKPVFGGLAAALAVLNPEQKEKGVLVIDLGAGTTDYTLFGGGILRHSGVLAVGGDHLANDLGCAFDISLEESRNLVRDPAVALALRDEKEARANIILPGGPARPSKNLPLEKIRKVAILRAEETLEIIAEEVGQAAPMWRPREVVLCGGGARLACIENLARQVFRAPVSLGKVRNVSGPADVLNNPEFAAPVGLVRYAAMRMAKTRVADGGIVSRITSVFRRNQHRTT